MPNSGYQCLINQNFRGSRKVDNLWVEPTDSVNKSWERFLANKYSRHMNRSNSGFLEVSRVPQSSSGSTEEPPKLFMARLDKGGIKVNSIAPFATLGKPTCGYYFSRAIDHKKRQTGIPSSDLVKYRYFGK